MDLRSGRLFWPSVNEPAPDFRAIESDTACDVAVIGAGITGALLADRLSQDGHRVVVLDRRPVCSGSTPASTGLLQYEIDTPLIRLRKLFGDDRAKRAYRASFRTLADFRDLIAGLDDDCGLTGRPSLYLACEPDDLDELRAECNARRSIDIAVDTIDGEMLRRSFGIDRPGALWSTQAMEVDPLRLSLALLRRAVCNGTRIFPGTEVAQYEPDADGVTLRTSRGFTVRAAHVAFATGYETPAFLDQSVCTLKSTYALASKPLDGFLPWRERCLIWESGQPYFYARTTGDDRMMIGGEDDDFADPVARDARIGSKADNLVGKFRDLFPALPIEPEFRWAGTFAETKDGLPYIGTTPQFPRGYLALGYGGNGITYSLIASQIIADRLASRPNADAELFAFDRAIAQQD
ncbi:MAG TPA: FAD-binding oxidoreductase [Tepidisphaeraceae bacterium]|jgi:glycine/D-amino acid oxidase-like deaminating enzyme|nr:FAD-binding oxidoreductase [Tepidisphaeraceae bacterium]